MFKLNLYLLSIVILFSFSIFVLDAKEKSSDFLPKTKDTKSNNSMSSKTESTDDANKKADSSEDDENDEDDKNDKDDDKESDEKAEEIDDPQDTFRLVAIYIIGNKPRALIKNLEKPEDAAKEFLVGDYLDEEQNFSVSKILLNPTIRVEIIDPNGLSYIMKPSNSDVGSAPPPSKAPKSSPSYSYKSKIKKSPSNTADTALPPSDKKDTTPAVESAIKNDSSQPVAIPPPASTSSSGDAVSQPPPVAQPQDSSTSPTTTTSVGSQPASSSGGADQVPAMSDSMTGNSESSSGGDSRPSNPFE